MRALGIVVGLLLAGCKVLNPAFGDDGGGTSNGDSATVVTSTGPERESRTSSATTGRPDPDGPDTTSSSSSNATTSSTNGRTSTTDDPRRLEPFRVEITFTPRVETLFDFVARVHIDEPYLLDIPDGLIDFEDPETAARIPFELAHYDAGTGQLDAWVLLSVWDDEPDEWTTIDLVVGYDRGAPQDPWVGYEHVWHLDDVEALQDAAGMAEGEFLGYDNNEGLVAGVAGGARDFDGADDLAEVPIVAQTSSVVAAYGWARVDTLPSGQAPLFSRSSGPPDEFLGADNGVDWALTVDGQGLARAVVRVTPGVISATPPLAVPDPVDGWHHYAFTSSTITNRMELIVDGAGSPLILSPLFTEFSAPSVAMGGWYGEDPSSSTAVLDGALDEVTVLHRELPFGWIATVHANQQVPSDTYIVGRPELE